MAMRLGLVDGRIHYGEDLATHARRGWLAKTARQRNVRLQQPDAKNTTAERPAVAWVNEGLWVATCPACELQTQLVWLDTPIMMCGNCWNSDIDGLWRTVTVPGATERAEVEAALLVRRQPQHQNWIAPGTPEWIRRSATINNKHDLRLLTGETPADLRRENAERGVGQGR